MIKKIVVGLLLFGTALSGYGQIGHDSLEINRYRISLLGGLPRIGGLQAEYVLPMANNHFGIKADVSVLPNLFPNSKTFTRYTGLGVNTYLNKTGSGPYAGLSYGTLFIRADEIENDIVDLDVRFNWWSSQIGIKTGKRFFFRFELGYSLIYYDVDKANEFLNETYGVEIKPTINFLHFPNGSIGFGYAF